MGLNFRKSISILPGVKVNLSKGGVSLSGGVKGLRKSINTKGQTTTTVSIPGTGIYTPFSQIKPPRQRLTVNDLSKQLRSCPLLPARRFLILHYPHRPITQNSVHKPPTNSTFH